MDKESKAVGFLDEVAGEGFENVTRDMMQVPFLKLCQNNSPEFTEPLIKAADGKSPGIMPGQFFNSLSHVVFGDKIKLVPLFVEQAWLVYEPNRGPFRGKFAPHSINTAGDQFKGGLFTAADAPCGGGLEVVDAIIMYALVEGHFDDGPIVFSMTSTMVKHARAFLTMLRTLRTPGGKPAPIFAGVWEIASVKNSNDSGSWYNIGEKTIAARMVRYVDEGEFTKYIRDARAAVVETVKEIDFNGAKETTAITADAGKSAPDASEY